MAEESEKQRVLFLCTHNSARSQMAEGWLRALAPDRFEALSAGTESRGIHPLAVRAMAEVGIDISEAGGHRSKRLEEFIGGGQPPIDMVVTVCDDAAESCPFFPGARRQEHWSFPDPSAVTGTEEQRLDAFRRVRDAIGARIDEFVRHDAGDAEPA